MNKRIKAIKAEMMGVVIHPDAISPNTPHFICLTPLNPLQKAIPITAPTTA